MKREELLAFCKGLSINDLTKIDLLSVYLADLSDLVIAYRKALNFDELVLAKSIEDAIDKTIDEIYKIRKDK